MIQIPHTSEPLIDANGAATDELRGFMDQVKRALEPEEVAASDIADISSAINTSGKYTSKLIWDTTNTRMMRAAGTETDDDWDVIDGSASVTPA